MNEHADGDEHYLVEHIRERLARDARTNELEVKVTVAGTKVFLSGFVTTEERRQAVAEVAREAAPGHEVHNQTEIAPLARAEEAEELT